MQINNDDLKAVAELLAERQDQEMTDFVKDINEIYGAYWGKLITRDVSAEIKGKVWGAFKKHFYPPPLNEMDDY